MNDAHFLSLIQCGYAARLTSGQAAKLLGFADHDVPVLVSMGLLKPLGTPMPNSPKHFALIEILGHATERDWLNRATKTLARHWQKKNGEQRNKRASQTAPGDPGDEDTHSEGAGQVSAKVPATGGQKYVPMPTQ
jgi:hypothetical protein